MNNHLTHLRKSHNILTCSTKCLKEPSTISQPVASLYNYVIRASIEKGSPRKSLLDYKIILLSGSIRPDQRMISYVLEACKLSMDIKTGLQTHSRIIKSGFELYPSLSVSLIAVYATCDQLDLARRVFDEIPHWDFSLVSANLLIAGYMRIGEFDNANRVFRKIPNKDVVSWNSMITGYVRNARPREAISLLRKMLSSDFEPDGFTFASVLTACSRIGARNHGEWVHGLIIEKQIELNFILSSALIDMYSKCGRVEVAMEVFESVQRDDVSIWNSMIMGLAIHGLASDVISTFSRMEGEDITPDSITFVGILTACSHSGMVEQGHKFFDLMRRRYSIEPEIEHYGAMVDILGRAGLLEEAHGIIRAMPMEPDVVIWRALLSACRMHGKPEFGELAIEKMANLNSGDYVLMSNIYSSARKWDSAERVRELMKKKGVRKNRGLSWVEMGGVVHRFKVGDQSHPESEAIYMVLEGLIRRIKIDGFVSSMELVLMDVSEEEKEGNLNCHSEKLATAYGILKTSPGTEIRVSKNLRTCYDCHCWMKMVSKVLNRVIVVRDRVRFHHFKSGSCSCKDYW